MYYIVPVRTYGKSVTRSIVLSSMAPVAAGYRSRRLLGYDIICVSRTGILIAVLGAVLNLVVL